MNIIEWIDRIVPVDKLAMKQAEEHWDSIAKPLNSLGILEETIIKIAGIIGNPEVSLEKKGVLVLCADHGVVEEGVTQTDSSVTAIVTESLANGHANVNAMAEVANASVITVDMGVATQLKSEHILNYKIAFGTKNITKGAAMTLNQAEQAVLTGIQLVKQCKEQGFNILATGEMGIGNTTISSALLSVLLEKEVEEVTGRGAGLPKEKLKHKIQVIKEAIKQNNPDRQLPLELLAKLGGFEIAGLTGVFLGGAIYHIPIVIDGLISATAALIATEWKKEVKEYMLASHLSKEPAASFIMEKLAQKPIIHGEFSLGEGTGAVALFPLLDMGLRVYHQNHTFTSRKIKPYEKFKE